MGLSVSKRVLLVVFAVAALLVIASTAAGQCSMCRTALTGSNNALFIRNFNIGVLVLLVPPVTIFCSIFVALKRYRNSAGEVTSNVRDDKAGNHL
jgi:hypothetical protein